MTYPRQCRRCGDVGHFAKTCEMPPLGRPDIGRMVRGRTMVLRRTVDALVEYIELLEASRRSAITELQRRMTTPHKGRR